MKKFKYPLAITGNKQQLEEIAEELKKIGYSYDIPVLGENHYDIKSTSHQRSYRMNGSLNMFKTTD
jgi:CO dehydrogenase/acetyl-CoA synthase epsilon subunit